MLRNHSANSTHPMYLVNQSCQMQGNKRNQGSALVIAIFIIIVISLLGSALVNILNSSQKNVAFEVLGTRAYTAAQSGIQWQLSQVFPLNSEAVVCENETDIEIATPSFSNTEGLAQCSVSVSCSNLIHNSVTYYIITSIGECAIDGEDTSRQIEVEARSL
jgi:MSHA biogenesis protein MshP